MKVSIALVSLMFIAAALSVQSASAGNRGICGQDMDAFCSNEVGELAAAQCLMSHEEDLTAGCKATVFSEVRMAVTQNCLGDIEAMCPQVPNGRHLIVPCLKQHFEELSPLCAAAVDRLKK